MKYRLPIKIVVIKNNTLGQIKWEQMVFLGNPEYGVRAAPDRLREVRRRRAAAPALRIEDPAECGRVLDAGAGDARAGA